MKKQDKNNSKTTNKVNESKVNESKVKESADKKEARKAIREAKKKVNEGLKAYSSRYKETHNSPRNVARTIIEDATALNDEALQFALQIVAGVDSFDLVSINKVTDGIKAHAKYLCGTTVCNEQKIEGVKEVDRIYIVKNTFGYRDFRTAFDNIMDGKRPKKVDINSCYLGSEVVKGVSVSHILEVVQEQKEEKRERNKRIKALGLQALEALEGK